MPAVENINGQAITLAMKHKDKRDPKHWKGFKFAVPFDYSMHNYLLRYYLAEHGLDPDTDVQIRAVPPPEMVANLRADNIDGFLAPDPVNQRAVFDGVGFIHMLSKDIWDGHPCCAFAASKEFVTQSPNTYAALLRASSTPPPSRPRRRTASRSRRRSRRPTISTSRPSCVEQVLTGTFADGLGSIVKRAEPHRFRSVPLGDLRGLDPDADEALGPDQGRCRLPGVAKQVFLATDAAKLMKEAGLTPPTATTKTFSVMGKAFDPAKPEDTSRASRSRGRLTDGRLRSRLAGRGGLVLARDLRCCSSWRLAPRHAGGTGAGRAAWTPNTPS